MSHTPNNISINILYEDPQIIVCVKPPGIATQSRSLAAPDMVRLLKKHLYTGRPAGEPYLAVIHRLDQPVSGILVFAKTPAAARELNRQLQASDSQSFGKYYRALTAKKPPQNSGVLENYMCKDARSNTSRICSPDTPGAKLARLEYQVVDDSFGWGRGISENPPSPSEAAHLLIHIFTGRHHQIRVQLANIGCPIIGDTKYNPQSLGNMGKTDAWQQICLCAYKLSFLHPKTKKPMTFELDSFNGHGQRL